MHVWTIWRRPYRSATAPPARTRPWCDFRTHRLHTGRPARGHRDGLRARRARGARRNCVGQAKSTTLERPTDNLERRACSRRKPRARKFASSPEDEANSCWGAWQTDQRSRGCLRGASPRERHSRPNTAEQSRTSTRLPPVRRRRLLPACFSAKILLQGDTPMPSFKTTEEQDALIEMAARFTRERIIPIAAECDQASRFPKDVFEAGWELGLVNPTVPTEYGGSGLGELDNALIAEQLAYGCTGIQTSMLANTLALTPILLAGNEEQKKKYLGMLTSSPLFASYCTTEPTGGSDVAGLRTRFTKQGDDYVLNGEKCWITNASFASFYVVFATSDPALRHKGIAAFIVDRDTPGRRVGKHEDKMGQRASDTASVHFEDVVVPGKNLLAPEGQGFKLAMETFNQTRPDIGAMATGLMQRCL